MHYKGTNNYSNTQVFKPFFKYFSNYFHAPNNPALLRNNPPLFGDKDGLFEIYGYESILAYWPLRMRWTTW